MEIIRLGSDGPTVSRLAYGCMRLAEDRASGMRALHAARDAGYTLFDHADIYGNGACERLFGEWLRETPGLRDEILIASKCGIRFADKGDEAAPKRYDFSAGYIGASVDGSLQRLGVERLDLLLLHRPDYLMDASELATTLLALHKAGKVAHFGVSNFSASQFGLLQSALSRRLLVNQVEINIHTIAALSDGTLDLCQQHRVTPQAWAPLAGVAYPAADNELSAAAEGRIRHELLQQSAKYAAPDWLIALAWLLRHPAKISPIIGSTTPERIAQAVAALKIDYSREDWYRLLEARNGQPVA